MFEVTVKGKSIPELKKSLEEIYNELNGKSSEVIIATKTEVVAEDNNFTNEDLALKHLPSEVKITELSVKPEGDVDSKGFPWDATIHASSKALVADGTYKVKRGVSDEEVARVQSSYIRTFNNQVVSAPAVVVAPVVSAPAVVVAPLPSMSSGHSLETFKLNFPMVLGGLISEGKVTPDYINQLKAYFKVEQIWTLTDLQKEELFESFVGYGLIQRAG